MAVIDKNMYEKLKTWCDHDKESGIPFAQRIMYVNSHDRALTDATIRKLMFELMEEDEYGELYISLFSAPNFHHNIREYYLNISRMYLEDPAEDANLLDVIKDFPATGGWLTLIIEDLEKLSEDPEKMRELIETSFAFGSTLAKVILIADGDYKDVFRNCEYALREMNDGLAATEDDHLLMVGYYEQETSPVRETITFETEEEQRDELTFYWDTLQEQFEKRYFDYEHYKTLFADTMEYLIPRVSEDKVFRKDLCLIEELSRMRRVDKDGMEGCEPWEFEAAQKFAGGLHETIVNLCDDDYCITETETEIEVWIEEAPQRGKGILISGSIPAKIKMCAKTACQQIDKLSDTICRCTYQGDSSCADDYLDDLENETR